MNEDTPTWYEAERAAREAAREAYEDNPEADPSDAAHEYADGCSDVIYTHRAIALWMGSADVQDYEDEANSIVDSDASISERICICVYFALRAAFEDEWHNVKAAA